METLGPAEVEALYEALYLEYGELAAQRKAAEKRMDVILDVLTGLGTLYPDVALEVEERLPSLGDLPDPRIPRGQDAVRSILVAKEGEWCTVADVVAELDRAGWLPDSAKPEAAVRTALERLIGGDEPVEKAKTGGGVFYRYAVESPGFEIFVDDSNRLMMATPSGPRPLVMPSTFLPEDA